LLKNTVYSDMSVLIVTAQFRHRTDFGKLR